MVADETTKPGYFKVQLVWNNVPRYNRHNITAECYETRQCIDIFQKY